MTTRLGLLGGTFDPPHYGHLVSAQEAAWQLRLDRVLFLPARQNPLKRDESSTPADARCEMVRLAIEDNSLFELSRLDLDRPPPSYTADLLRALCNEDREVFFLVGADIEILETGIRPGEKLFEELFFDAEHVTPTTHSKVLRARNARLGLDGELDLEDLIKLARANASADVLRAAIKLLVPEYTGVEARAALHQSAATRPADAREVMLPAASVAPSMSLAATVQ